MDCRVPDKSLKTVFSFAYACTFLYICFQNATIMKYPIGIQSFDQIIEDGYVYVARREDLFLEPSPPLRQESAGIYAGELFFGA